MQPWGRVSTIPGANTLFEGRQTQRKETDRRDTEIKTEKRQERENGKETHTKKRQR
jgi:hypothetical protein